jgi:hypothetical protein
MMAQIMVWRRGKGSFEEVEVGESPRVTLTWGLKGFPDEAEKKKVEGDGISRGGEEERKRRSCATH